MTGELTQQRYLLECAKEEERERQLDAAIRAAQETEAAIRRDERERCRNRINVLIEMMGYQRESLGSSYAARLSALMAARSAVMRGDDDGAPL